MRCAHICLLDYLRSEGRVSVVNICPHDRHKTCNVPSLPDRKTFRTALQFLRSFLQPLFFALFLSRSSQRVCVCVCWWGGVHLCDPHGCPRAVTSPRCGGETRGGGGVRRCREVACHTPRRPPWGSHIGAERVHRGVVVCKWVLGYLQPCPLHDFVSVSLTCLGPRAWGIGPPWGPSRLRCRHGASA